MTDSNRIFCIPLGLYKWLIVVAAFLVQLSIGSTVVCPGIFFVMFRENLGGSEWFLSVATSMNVVASYLICPVAGMATEYFGCRTVGIIGGLTGSIGLVLTAFVTETWQLLITFGLISGIGMGVCYIPTVAIIAYYFQPELRAFAISIAVCGVGSSGIILPPILRWMENTYAWRGTLLLTGGIFLHAVLFACLFSQPAAGMRAHEKAPQAYNSREKDIPQQEIILEQDMSKLQTKSNLAESAKLEVSPLQLTLEKDTDNSQNMQQDLSLATTKGRFFSKLLPSVFKNTGYNLLLLLNVLYYIGMSTVLVHIVACGIARGFSADQGAMFILTLSICNTFSKPVYGCLAQVPCIGAAWTMAVAFLLCGMATIAFPFNIHFEMMVACSALIGLFHGSFASMPPIVTIDLVGVELLASAFGYVCIANGLGSFLGGAIAGWLYELTENYYVPFIVAGIMNILSGILGGIIAMFFSDGPPCCKRKQQVP